MKKIFLLMAVLVIGFFALFYDGTVFDLKKSKLLPDLNYKPDISQGKSKYQSTCMNFHMITPLTSQSNWSPNTDKWIYIKKLLWLDPGGAPVISLASSGLKMLVKESFLKF